MENMHCKIYINTAKTVEDLRDGLEDFFGIIPDRFFSFESDYFFLDIRENKESDKEKANNENDFLLFSFFLDVDILDTGKREKYIHMISNLLEMLWENKYQAIAACDFESELPNSGGYMPG